VSCRQRPSGREEVTSLGEYKFLSSLCLPRIHWLTHCCSRVAHAERNLGHLAPQLDASLQAPTPRHIHDSTDLQGSFLPVISPEFHTSAATSSQYASTPQSHHSASTPGTTFSGSQVTRGIDIHDPEALLKFYREMIADAFPFVVVPQGITAYSLSRDKPFLFKAIVMVASAQDVKAQAAMAEEIVEYLSLHVLLRCEKSLDLLQGLLVFAAWYFPCPTLDSLHIILTQNQVPCSYTPWSSLDYFT
jgi:hypothetical protein